MNDHSSGEFANIMYLADCFFIQYSVMCEYSKFCISGNLFSIGQSVELYLKAVFIYQTGNSKKAFEYGHKIRDLYKACQKEDSNFIPTFKIQSYNLEENTNTEHYYKHQEFYFIAENLPKLKYGGIPKNSENSRFPFMSLRSFNLYWIEFVKDIRSYLNYPGGNYTDFIKTFLEINENLSETVRTFLGQIYK